MRTSMFKASIIVTVLLIVLALPAIGMAKGRPDNPGPPPDDEPRGGYGCLDENNEPTASVALPTQFDPALWCVDIMSTEAGVWSFEIDTSNGRLPRVVYLSIRDSIPGDFCWVTSLRNRELASLDTDGDGVVTIDTATIGWYNPDLAQRAEEDPDFDVGEIPAAEANACPDDPAHGGPWDDRVSPTDPSLHHPLVLAADVTGKNTAVTITVSVNG